VHSAADLDWVAAELNDRPRKRFGFRKPDELIGHLLQGEPLVGLVKWHGAETGARLQ
jgi:hypothetical protein